METVVVIGGGIVGVSCALELQRAGKAVTLVDRVAPGDKTQTSYGNAGILAREGVVPAASPSILLQLPKILFSPNTSIHIKIPHILRIAPWAAKFILNGTQSKTRQFMPAMNHLLYDTIERHFALAKGTQAEPYLTRGDLTCLYRKQSQFTSDRFVNSIREQAGVKWETLDRSALLDRDPNIGARYKFGVAYKDHGWVTDPSSYVAALAEHFCEIGGVLKQGEVSAISGNNVILKEGQTLTGDQIVLATGAWSKDLAQSLGVNTPLQGERGYHLNIKNPSIRPANTYLIMDNRYGCTPMGDYLRVAGQSEFAPLDTSPNPIPIANLKRFIKQLYPNLEYDSVEEWQGTRPTLVDSLPMIGRAPKASNVIFAFGSQHLGLTMGPKMGQMVCDMVLGKPSNIDLTPYAADRFS